MASLNFSEVENYLYKSVREKIDIGYSAGFALERVKYTLKLLGDPQERIKVIHIAGTSGKGSTATFISRFLSAHGFKTGLTLSPHLVDIRERVQINNELLSREQFAANFCELLPTFEKVAKSKYQSLSYFEMLMILAYYTFAKEKVDYAVIETGLGGTFDASNCVTNSDKLCVISKIGKDHTKILGTTIAEIAGNKAGVINSGQKVVYVVSGKISDKVIRERAATTKSEIFPLHPNQNLKTHKTSPNKSIHDSKTDFSTTDYNAKTDFTFLDFSLTNLPTQTLPNYQLENLSLSLAALVLISKKDNWQIQPDKIHTVIKKYCFPGRFEILNNNGKTVILDGAHNPQKISALVTSLRDKFPGQKFNFIIAFKEDKDVDAMLKTLHTIAYKFFPTRFSLPNQDIKLKSVHPKHIQKLLQKNNFSGEIHTCQNLESALHILAESEHNISKQDHQSSHPSHSKNVYIKTHHKKEDDTITVITGSLYLIAEFKNLKARKNKVQKIKE